MRILTDLGMVEEWTLCVLRSCETLRCLCAKELPFARFLVLWQETAEM